MAQLEEIHKRMNCNCAIGDCYVIESIFGKVISANTLPEPTMSMGTNDFPLLRTIAENSGPSFTSGIKAGKNCFHVKINKKFTSGTALLDLTKHQIKTAQSQILIKDQLDQSGIEITLLPSSKGSIEDLVAYLGFGKRDSEKEQMLTDEEFQAIATKLGVEKCVVKALAIVEVGGKNGFLKDGITQKIRYEGHYMKRFILNDKLLKSSLDDYFNRGYQDVIYSYSERNKYTHGWDKLIKAREIDADYANQSSSWGMGQIMGANYIQAGFGSIMDFVEEQYSYRGQISTFINFCAGDSKLLTAMKTKDFETIARIYNGKYYKDNNYHIQMSNAYEKCK